MIDFHSSEVQGLTGSTRGQVTCKIMLLCKIIQLKVSQRLAYTKSFQNLQRFSAIAILRKKSRGLGGDDFALRPCIMRRDLVVFHDGPVIDNNRQIFQWTLQCDFNMDSKRATVNCVLKKGRYKAKGYAECASRIYVSPIVLYFSFEAFALLTKITDAHAV